MDKNTAQHPHKHTEPDNPDDNKKGPQDHAQYKWNVAIAIAIIIFILSFSFYFLSTSSVKHLQKVANPPHATYYPPSQYAPAEVIIQYKEGQSPDELTDPTRKKELDQIDQEAGVISKQHAFPSDDAILKRFYLLKLQDGSDVIKVENLYLQYDFTESIQPNFKAHATDIPNDTDYSQQWDMKKMSMEQAWGLDKGSKSVIVAIVDTGIDYNHPDLPTDIIKGENLIANNQDPFDDNGHGTHVAGTIGAVSNNAKGIAGINWNVQLMAVKVLDNQGNGFSNVISNGIVYAADNGAKVINLSIAGDQHCVDTPEYQTAIDHAISKGAVVAIAAGNGPGNNGVGQDALNASPASCNGNITVGASNQSDQRAGFSNFGSRVDIAAPGVSILSTKSSGCSAECTNKSNIFDTNYLFLQGTSMATPHVSGVAALLFALNPSLTPQAVRDCLVSSGDPISTDQPIGPRLNALKAIQTCVPATPTQPAPTQTPTPGPTLTSTPTPIQPTPTQSQPTETQTPTQQPTPTDTPVPGVPTNTPGEQPTVAPTTVVPTTVCEGHCPLTPTISPSISLGPTPIFPHHHKSHLPLWFQEIIKGILDDPNLPTWIKNFIGFMFGVTPNTSF